MRALDALTIQMEPLTRTLETVAASKPRRSRGSDAKSNKPKSINYSKIPFCPILPCLNSIRRMHEMSLDTSVFAATLERVHSSWFSDLSGADIASEKLGKQSPG